MAMVAQERERSKRNVMVYKGSEEGRDLSWVLSAGLLQDRKGGGAKKESLLGSLSRHRLLLCSQGCALL